MLLNPPDCYFFRGYFIIFFACVLVEMWMVEYLGPL